MRERLAVFHHSLSSLILADCPSSPIPAYARLSPLIPIFVYPRLSSLIIAYHRLCHSRLSSLMSILACHIPSLGGVWGDLSPI